MSAAAYHNVSHEPEEIHDSIKCTICNINITLKPFELPCGHTFHYNCLTGMVRSAPVCPTCGVHVETASDSMHGLHPVYPIVIADEEHASAVPADDEPVLVESAGIDSSDPSTGPAIEMID
jgi:hypothetical protein